MTDTPTKQPQIEPPIEEWMTTAAREAERCASELFLNLIDLECWVDDVSRIIARHYAERERETCKWTYDEDTCSWDSDCGTKWVFEVDGPEENEYVYCHQCGRPIEVALKTTSPSEEGPVAHLD